MRSRTAISGSIPLPPRPGTPRRRSCATSARSMVQAASPRSAGASRASPSIRGSPGWWWRPTRPAPGPTGRSRRRSSASATSASGGTPSAAGPRRPGPRICSSSPRSSRRPVAPASRRAPCAGSASYPAPCWRWTARGSRSSGCWCGGLRPPHPGPLPRRGRGRVARSRPTARSSSPPCAPSPTVSRGGGRPGPTRSCSRGAAALALRRRAWCVRRRSSSRSRRRSVARAPREPAPAAPRRV